MTQNENVTETPEKPAEQPLSKDAKTFGMLCHLIALAGFIVPVIGNIVGPLVIWLIKKDEFPFVDDQGKESLNFQISITIYGIIASILMVVLIGFLLIFAVLIFDLIMVIMATVKANSGEKYRYPLTIRFLK